MQQRDPRERDDPFIRCRNCVGSQGVKLLLDALETNYTLRILDLLALHTSTAGLNSALSLQDLASNSVLRPGWSVAGEFEWDWDGSRGLHLC